MKLNNPYIFELSQKVKAKFGRRAEGFKEEFNCGTQIPEVVQFVIEEYDPLDHGVNLRQHERVETVEWLRAKAQATLDRSPANTVVAEALCDAADELEQRKSDQ